MKLPHITILLLSCISNALAVNMHQLVNEWYKSSYREVNDETALSRLSNDIMNAFPEAQDRLNGMYEIVINEQDPDKQLSFFSALGFMWHDLAPPSARASFLEARIASADTKQIGFLYGILENDALKSDVRAKVKSGVAYDWIGAKKEQMFTAFGYRTNSGDLNARLAAMLFEMMPASVITELAASSALASAVNQVQEVEKLRLRLELTNTPDDEAQTWKNTQEILREMIEANDPALDAYVARILAWRKAIKPRLQNDIKIIEVLTNRNDLLALYLLEGRNIQGLINIKQNVPANFKTAKAHALSAQDSSVSRIDEKKLKRKDAAAASKEPTSSTPWSIIVVLVVAAIGLLWLWLKNRK